MGVRAYLEEIEPVLRPQLAAGEKLLAASPLVHDPGTTDDVSFADELKNLLDPGLYLGLSSHPGGFLQQAAFGRALVGSPESTGGRLHGGVGTATAPALTVTDTGIVTFDVSSKPRGQGFWRRAFGPSDRIATLVARVDREEILAATPAPKGLLRRGRFIVVCKDGSACALVCSPPSLSGPVIAAIGTNAD